MPNTWRVPTDDVPMCPECQRDLSFIGAWTFRGLWGYEEVRTYECSQHGPIFVSPPVAAGQDSSEQPDTTLDHGDHDSLVPAPRKPTPPLNAGAIAIPEPDSD